MTQTGPDLIGAGYPISRPLNALLGGNMNSTQGNVPQYTNLDWNLGSLQDGTVVAASAMYVAVPVTPGVTVSKLSLLTGGTGASVTGYAALYTGTGSSPGTVGSSPLLIGTSASLPTTATASVGSATAFSYTFSTPLTITSAHAPYGYIYAAFTASATSLISMTCACAAMYQWTSTSPYTLFGVSASTVLGSTSAGSAGSIGSITRYSNPPVVFLS